MDTVCFCVLRNHNRDKQSFLMRALHVDVHVLEQITEHKSACVYLYG